MSWTPTDERLWRDVSRKGRTISRRIEGHPAKGRKIETLSKRLYGWNDPGDDVDDKERKLAKRIARKATSCDRTPGLANQIQRRVESFLAAHAHPNVATRGVFLKGDGAADGAYDDNTLQALGRSREWQEYSIRQQLALGSNVYLFDIRALRWPHVFAEAGSPMPTFDGYEEPQLVHGFVALVSRASKGSMLAIPSLWNNEEPVGENWSAHHARIAGGLRDFGHLFSRVLLSLELGKTLPNVGERWHSGGPPSWLPEWQTTVPTMGYVEDLLIANDHGKPPGLLVEFPHLSFAAHEIGLHERDGAVRWERDPRRGSDEPDSANVAPHVAEYWHQFGWESHRWPEERANAEADVVGAHCLALIIWAEFCQWLYATLADAARFRSWLLARSPQGGYLC